MQREKLTLAWRGATKAVPDVIFVDVTDERTPAVRVHVPHVVSVARRFEPGPLDTCLGHWIAWMHQDDRDLGVKNQGIVASGDPDDGEHQGYDDTSALAEAAAARMSREIGMATNAMIDSLDRAHKAAIYRRCNIASVWRFPRLDFTETLPLAEIALIEKLRKNIATRAFW